MSMLTGKNIVVIGGTGGIGYSATKAFVAAGAHVVVAGRDQQKSRNVVQELGKNVRSVTGDAGEPGVAEDAVALCIREFGPLHGLYHVAGGSGRRFGDGPLHELTLEGWETTLTLNLTSVMVSNRAAIRMFNERGTGGAILNLSSVLAFSPSPGFFATHAYA